MEYRLVRQEELPQVEDLWDYCFEKREELFFRYYFKCYCGKCNQVYGGFDEDAALKTMLHVNPYCLRLRGRVLAVPYLVGIATAPEARGQHLLRSLLTTVLSALRTRVSFVTLMPVYAGIYQPYDFAFCYYCHEHLLPLRQLQHDLQPLATEELRVELVQLKPELLAPLYARLTANWHAVPQRDAAAWEKLLAVHALENVRCALVRRGSEAVGYLLYSLQGKRFLAIELLAEDFTAEARLLQFAAQHLSEAEKLHWRAPVWDKLHLRLAEHQQSGSLLPFIMARCVNCAQALQQLQPEPELAGELVLTIEDRLLPDNALHCRLRVKQGRLSLEPTQAAPTLRLSVGAFTQLYFGAFSARELWEAGLLQCQEPSQLSLLEQLLPKQRTFMNEYF